MTRGTSRWTDRRWVLIQVPNFKTSTGSGTYYPLSQTDSRPHTGVEESLSKTSEEKLGKKKSFSRDESWFRLKPYQESLITLVFEDDIDLDIIRIKTYRESDVSIREPQSPITPLPRDNLRMEPNQDSERKKGGQDTPVTQFRVHPSHPFTGIQFNRNYGDIRQMDKPTSTVGFQPDLQKETGESRSHENFIKTL